MDARVPTAPRRAPAPAARAPRASRVARAARVEAFGEAIAVCRAIQSREAALAAHLMPRDGPAYDATLGRQSMAADIARAIGELLRNP